jgi:hypothetical protein
MVVRLPWFGDANGGKRLKITQEGLSISIEMEDTVAEGDGSISDKEGILGFPPVASRPGDTPPGLPDGE